jgi:GMP synthase (glutamine-hydrolysing)
VKTALVIRHVGFEDLGAFGPSLEARSYRIGYVEAGTADWAAIDPLAPDLLVVLGGPIGAYEEDRYPFLTPELRLIADRLAADRPTLGICLGAQLMAWALGADVRPGPAKEIGWAPLALTADGLAGPLRHLADGPVLHWHGDVLDLPAGATRLASTPLCPNQAFMRGPRALACQFHPEARIEGSELWLIGHAVELAAAGIKPGDLREETYRHAPAAAERGRAMLADWLSGWGG